MSDGRDREAEAAASLRRWEALQAARTTRRLDERFDELHVRSALEGARRLLARLGVAELASEAHRAVLLGPLASAWRVHGEGPLALALARAELERLAPELAAAVRLAGSSER